MDARKSALERLPLDVLLEILYPMELRDLVSVRLTCRTLYETSKIKTLLLAWTRRVLHKYHTHPRSLGFDRLEDLSVEQLERILTRPYVVQRHLLQTQSESLDDVEVVRSKPAKVYDLGSPLGGFMLVPGGRWMLVFTGTSIDCWDLQWIPGRPAHVVSSTYLHAKENITSSATAEFSYEECDADVGDCALNIVMSIEDLGTSHSLSVYLLKFQQTHDGVVIVLSAHVELPRDLILDDIRAPHAVLSNENYVAVWNWETHHLGVFPIYFGLYHSENAAEMVQVETQVELVEAQLWSLVVYRDVNTGYQLSMTLYIYELPTYLQAIADDAPLDELPTLIENYMISVRPSHEFPLHSTQHEMPISSLSTSLYINTRSQHEECVLLTTMGLDHRGEVDFRCDGLRLCLNKEHAVSLNICSLLRYSPSASLNFVDLPSVVFLPDAFGFAWYDIGRDERLFTLWTRTGDSTDRSTFLPQPAIPVLRVRADPFQPHPGDPHFADRRGDICDFTGRVITVSPGHGQFAILDLDIPSL